MKRETRNAKRIPRSNTIAGVITQAVADLAGRGIPNPRLDVEVLLAHTLGLTRASLYARMQASLSETDTVQFHQLLQRRLQREPLQYITGVQEFWSLEVKVNRDVLIPRPETELVVETALRLLSHHAPRTTHHGVVSSQQSVISRREKRPQSTVEFPTPDLRPPTPKILDVGTGSGCIAIALAKEFPNAEIWATDISSAALTVAQENAQRHRVAQRIHFLQGNLFAPLQDQQLSFDLIVSNPPYIVHDDIPMLQPEVSNWEPHNALDGGSDGLDFYRRLLTESPKYLRSDGWLIMEIGHGQAADVLQLAQAQTELMTSSGVLDYEGRERVVIVRKR